MIFSFKLWKLQPFVLCHIKWLIWMKWDIENSNVKVKNPTKIEIRWRCFFVCPEIVQCFSIIPNNWVFWYLGGFICTFSLLISLSFTFQSSKFNYSSSSKCCLTRTDNSNESVQLSFHYLKRDRTRRCFLFSVTCHIRIFWTDCEMIPELINHFLLTVEIDLPF